MVRRTAWATQERNKICELAAAHANPPISPNGLVALRFKDTPAEKLPSEVCETLIRADASGLTPKATQIINCMITKGGDDLKAMVKHEAQNMHGIVPKIRVRPVKSKKVLKVLRTSLDFVPKEDQRTFAGEAIVHILDRESKAIPERLRKETTAYLRSRQIPIEDAILQRAVNEYLRSTALIVLANRLDVRAIEAAYIRERKNERRQQMATRTKINSLAEQICEGLYLTNNQRKVVRSFVTGKLSGISGAEEEFVRSSKERFYQEFRPQDKRPAVPRLLRVSGPMKLGSREERMANHVQREKPRQECPCLPQPVCAAPKENGKPFDKVERYASEASEEDASTVLKLKEMLSRGGNKPKCPDTPPIEGPPHQEDIHPRLPASILPGKFWGGASQRTGKGAGIHRPDGQADNQRHTRVPVSAG